LTKLCNISFLITGEANLILETIWAHAVSLLLLWEMSRFNTSGPWRLVLFRFIRYRYYDLYQRLQLEFYVLLMMGAMDTRNM